MRRTRPRHDIYYGPDEIKVQEERLMIYGVEHKHSGAIVIHAELRGVIDLPDRATLIDRTLSVSQHVEIRLRAVEEK